MFVKTLTDWFNFQTFQDLPESNGFKCWSPTFYSIIQFEYISALLLLFCDYLRQWLVYRLFFFFGSQLHAHVKA